MRWPAPEFSDFIYRRHADAHGHIADLPLSAVTSYELITIPMFLLMAEFVLVSGIADDLFKATAAWVGRVPGGLGMATALAGAGSVHPR